MEARSLDAAVPALPRLTDTRPRGLDVTVPAFDGRTPMMAEEGGSDAAAAASSALMLAGIRRDERAETNAAVPQQQAGDAADDTNTDEAVAVLQEEIISQTRAGNYQRVSELMAVKKRLKRHGSGGTPSPRSPKIVTVHPLGVRGGGAPFGSPPEGSESHPLASAPAEAHLSTCACCGAVHSGAAPQVPMAAGGDAALASHEKESLREKEELLAENAQLKAQVLQLSRLAQVLQSKPGSAVADMSVSLASVELPPPSPPSPGSPADGRGRVAPSPRRRSSSAPSPPAKEGASAQSPLSRARKVLPLMVEVPTRQYV
jgi:hypothetical protein